MTNKKIYLIGTGSIALAVLIILSVTVLPAAVQKHKMKERLDLAASAMRLSVGDPLFETGDVLDNKGREVLLEGEDLSTVQEMLRQLCAGGCHKKGSKKMLGGTLAMSLKARTDAGEIVILYLEEARFYYIDDETAVLFEAKNKNSYEALYQKLIACLAV